MAQQYLVPLTENSGSTADLNATPNTSVAITVPGAFGTFNRPSAFQIFFEDPADGTLVRGRVGIQGSATLPTNPINASTGLGHVAPNNIAVYPLAASSTHLIVASSTASARCIVTWLYNR